MRLEVAHNCPEPEVELLQAQFGLESVDVYRVNGPVNLHRLDKMADIIDRPDLKFRNFVPASLSHKRDRSFERLQRGDVLLHHPFESFSPVVELVRQAANDPSVLAIKQTVYRSGKNSPMVEALVDAARAGKEVTAVVELQARFDRANIDLATGSKTRAQMLSMVSSATRLTQMLLIVRREQHGIRRYAHLGTGNYHAGIQGIHRLRIDDGRFGIHGRCTQAVMQLTGLGKAFVLRSYCNRHSRFSQNYWNYCDEVKAARAGHEAYVCLKLNL